MNTNLDSLTEERLADIKRMADGIAEMGLSGWDEDAVAIAMYELIAELSRRALPAPSGEMPDDVRIYSRRDMREAIETALRTSASPQGDESAMREVFGMPKGEWSWRSYTAGENAGKTAIVIGGKCQPWFYLDWSDYDGRPEEGRKDAEGTAHIICTAVNTHRVSRIAAPERVQFLEGLFDFTDPEVMLHWGPNDPVTCDAVVVRRSHWEAKQAAPERIKAQGGE